LDVGEQGGDACARAHHNGSSVEQGDSAADCDAEQQCTDIAAKQPLSSDDAQRNSICAHVQRYAVPQKPEQYRQTIADGTIADGSGDSFDADVAANPPYDCDAEQQYMDITTEQPVLGDDAQCYSMLRPYPSQLVQTRDPSSSDESGTVLQRGGEGLTSGFCPVVGTMRFHLDKQRFDNRFVLRLRGGGGDEMDPAAVEPVVAPCTAEPRALRIVPPQSAQ